MIKATHLKYSARHFCCWHCNFFLSDLLNLKYYKFLPISRIRWLKQFQDNFILFSPKKLENDKVLLCWISHWYLTQIKIPKLVAEASRGDMKLEITMKLVSWACKWSWLQTQEQVTTSGWQSLLEEVAARVEHDWTSFIFLYTC